MKTKFFFLVFISCFLLSSCQLGYIIRKESLSNKLDKNKIFFLLSTNNNKYNLKEIYENHAGIVLVFWQTACPCVKNYQEKINKLSKIYEKKNIKFIHVSSNSEDFELVKKEYNSRNIPIKLMRDPSGALAQQLRVRSTPTAVLINPNGDVKFMGWVDNQYDWRSPKYKPYLTQALEEYTNNKYITTPTSPMFGCKIN